MDERISQLLLKKISGEATETDLKEMDLWVETHIDDAFLLELLQAIKVSTEIRDLETPDTQQWANELWKKLVGKLRIKNKTL